MTKGVDVYEYKNQIVCDKKKDNDFGNTSDFSTVVDFYVVIGVATAQTWSIAAFERITANQRKGVENG